MGCAEYSNKQIRKLRKKGVTFPIKGIFIPGTHCSGERPFGRSNACFKAGCTGMKGIKSLKGIPLPCGLGLLGSPMGITAYFS